MKNSLPRIALQFLLLLPLLGFAQPKRITGRVVDAETKEPIPFASIGLLEEGTGALTNEKGYFQVIGPNKFEQDSLVFMTLGYSRRAVFVERGKAEGLIIELSRAKMEGIRIISCPVKPNVAENNATTAGEIITGQPGTQYAFFIDREKGKRHRKLQSASVYVGENGLPMQAFRVCIYKADGNNHSPNTKLLAEPAFLTVPRAGEWYTRDLSRYNAVAPKEGYYVVLEFGKPAEALPQPDMDSYMPSGQMMRPAFDFKKSSIWTYSQEKGWNLLPQSSSSRRYNAMVKVEVEAVD